MSDEEEELETCTSVSSTSDKEDEIRDLELMDEILQSIDTLQTESSQVPTFPQAIKETSTDKKTYTLDELSLIELKLLLEQVSQALECNNQIQSMLLMKEVKLLAIKKELISLKSRRVAVYKEKEDDEKKVDIGRFIVKFKAPYFKNKRDFSGYVIVPEKELPLSSQRFESRATEWYLSDLKELEEAVKNFLTSRSFRRMLKRNPTTLQDKLRLIDSYYSSKSASLSNLVPPDFDDIIDWYAIASKLRKYHSPYECQKAWNIFLKPSINRKKWTAGEKNDLRKLALEHNFQDWDTIAAKLETHRSGYQCFHQYQDLIRKVAEGDWTPAEEKLLIHLVKECTYGDTILWHKINYFFETRSLAQIYRKWRLSNIGKTNAQGNFTEKEDKIILDRLLFNKNCSINQVAKTLKRLPSQVRYRYTMLKQGLTHRYGEWSVEEDRQLLSLVEEYGTKRWALISKHMPTRGRVQIRHRYKNLVKIKASHPDLDVTKLKRPKRTVYQERKKVNMKYVMRLAGIKNVDKTKKMRSNIGVDTTEGTLILNADELNENCQKTCKLRSSKHKKCVSTAIVEPKSTSKKKNKIAAELPFDQKVIDFYENVSRYNRTPINPINSFRSCNEAELTNVLLKFAPSKVKDSFTLELGDPYYEEMFRLTEFNNDPEVEQVRNSSTNRNGLLPPSVTSLVGFNNLLLDINFNDEDLKSDNIEKELASLYNGNDRKTVEAVNKWRDRLKTLFLWPIVLSEIYLENKDAGTQRKQDPEHKSAALIEEMQGDMAQLKVSDMLVRPLIDMTVEDLQMEETTKSLRMMSLPSGEMVFTHGVEFDTSVAKEVPVDLILSSAPHKSLIEVDPLALPGPSHR